MLVHLELSIVSETFCSRIPEVPGQVAEYQHGCTINKSLSAHSHFPTALEGRFLTNLGILIVVYVFLLFSMYSYCFLFIIIVVYVFLLLSMYSYCCPCILIVVYVFLLFSMYSYCFLFIIIVVYVFLLLSMYSYRCLCILIVVYVFL